MTQTPSETADSQPESGGALSDGVTSDGRSIFVLQKAVETMRIGLTVTDLDGRILYVNPVEAWMHGYEVRELLGKPGRILGTNQQNVASIPPRAMEPKSPWRRESFNRRKSGEVFPVRLSSDFVRNADGELVGFITLCEDITEERRLRAAVERGDAILSVIGLASRQFLEESSFENNIDRVLRALGEATGVSRVAFRPRTAETHGFLSESLRRWTEGPETRRDDSDWLLVARDADGWMRRHWDALVSGEPLIRNVSELPERTAAFWGAEDVRSLLVLPVLSDDVCWGTLELEDARNELVWSGAELDALRTAANTLGAAFARRKAERDLAVSEERYRELFENASDLIHVVSPDGTLRHVNRAWLATLDYGVEDLRDLNVREVLHPRCRERWDEMVSTLRAGKPVGTLELTFVRRDGSSFDVNGSVSSRFVESRLTEISGIFRDVNERPG